VLRHEGRAAQGDEQAAVNRVHGSSCTQWAVEGTPALISFREFMRSSKEKRPLKGAETRPCHSGSKPRHAPSSRPASRKFVPFLITIQATRISALQVFSKTLQGQQRLEAPTEGRFTVDLGAVRTT
jgi:hypothetical protein